MLMSVEPDELFLYCHVSGDAGKEQALTLAQTFEDNLLSRGCPLNEASKGLFALTVKQLVYNELFHPGELAPLGTQANIRALECREWKYG